MWTTEKANRSADLWLLAAPLVSAGIGIGFAVRGDWGAAAVGGLMAAWSAFAAYRRARRLTRPQPPGDTPLVDGRATDEREAYIQLHAWANVGRIAVLLTLVLVVAFVALDLSAHVLATVAAALGALGAVWIGSIVVLPRRI